MRGFDEKKDTPTISVNGPLSQASFNSLIELRVERSLNQPSRCVLRFVNLVANLRRPDNAVTVKSASGELLFQGVVLAAEVEQRTPTSVETTLIAYDKSALMSTTTVIHSYQKLSSQDVVSAIAARHGLNAKASSTPKINLDYMLQASTDLELVDLLAARAGFDWWVDGTTLHFETINVADAPAVSVEAADLGQLSVRTSNNHPTKVTVRGWDPKKQSFMLAEESFVERHLSATGALSKFSAEEPFGVRVRQTSALPAESREEMKALATAILRQSVSASVHAEGFGTDLTALALGKAIEITKSPTFEGSYVLTELQHRWGPKEPLTTSFVCGNRRTGDSGVMADTMGTRQSIETYYGVLPGVVTDIKDPENHGRVRVKFESLNSVDSSAWARPVLQGAGKGRGAVSIPEVDDEVLIVFESGDLRRPLVLGGIFNSQNKIPEAAAVDDAGGTVTSRRTTSRMGHYLEFADEMGPSKLQHVLLSLKDEKTQLRLDSKKAEILVPQGNPFTIQVGTMSSIEFDGDGKITVKCNELEIKATKSLKAEASTVEAKASASMKLQGTTLEAKGSGTAKVEGGTMLELKGAIVKIN